MNKCNYKKRVSILIAALTAVTAIAETVVNCNVRLADNSSVKGVLGNENIVGEPIFQPELTISTHLIKEIAFKDTNGTASVELKNGDRLTMTMATEIFSVSSILGNLDIPKNNIKSMSLSLRRDGAAATDEDGLVYWCTMDSVDAVTSPAVGPAGVLKGGAFRPGKIGDALYVPPYTMGTEVRLPIGFIGAKGCIEFWAKIENTRRYFSDCGDPRLFDCYAGGEFLHLEFNSNDGGGRGGLCGGVPGAVFGTVSRCSSQLPFDMLFPKGDYSEWHHYAVVWDSMGIDVNGEKVYCTAMLDGMFITMAHSPMGLGFPYVEYGKLADMQFNLCFPVMPRYQMSHSKSAVSIDEIKIWNYAKTTFDFE